jgi:hypothetical protein
VDSSAAFVPVLVSMPQWPTHRIADSGLRTWLEEVQYRIKEAFLLSDDWDHEGAVAVSREAAIAADNLAQSLDAQHVGRPFVSATQDGGIGFEWTGGQWEVFIDVLAAGLEVTVRDSATGGYWEGDPEAFEAEFSRALSSLVP